MIYILAIMCVLCCLISGGLAVFVLWQTDRERKRLIELLAAKDYSDYKAFETQPENSAEHKNLFVNREKAQQARQEIDRE